MKKLLILMLLSLFLVGCTTQKSDYQKIVEELQNETVPSSDFPCNIKIEYDKITNEELVYQLTLDNPKEPMYDIKTIIIHDQQTKDMFPSLGVADQRMHLVPNHYEEDKGFAKGIILVGYLPFSNQLSDFHGEFKVYLQYRNDLNEYVTKYFIQKI